jgi:two-component system LytT family response regulator
MSDARKLRAVIVDDEPPARALLREYLAELGDVEVVAECGDGFAAVAAVTEHDPDLLLLDIQMPGEDGFALLESLVERPAVVFVTAFDHYAVRAFEANAVDYLLKPFRRERLVESIARARRDLERPEDLSRRLADLLGGLRRETAPEHMERFTVRVGPRQLILKADEVLWFGAEDKLVFAATAGDRHYVNFTLDQLERRLDPRRFARVHRGAIVNLDHAAVLRPGFAGTYRLQLKDEARTEVPVSRARARQLKDRLGA